MPLVQVLVGGAYMPPFGMYAFMAPRTASPRAPVHSSPIGKRWHTPQNDVYATRQTAALIRHTSAYH
jgi:hypothetical protein